MRNFVRYNIGCFLQWWYEKRIEGLEQTIQRLREDRYCAQHHLHQASEECGEDEDDVEIHMLTKQRNTLIEKLEASEERWFGKTKVAA